MIWVSFAILALMASIEAGLAYMREILLQDEFATNALLRGGADDVSSAVNRHLWITTAAQMGMGFILPFALTFVAIPLETFVHSLRTVMGLVAIGVLRAFALLLRMLQQRCSRHLGALAQRLYDLPLFLPSGSRAGWQPRSRGRGDARGGRAGADARGDERPPAGPEDPEEGIHASYQGARS